MGFRHYSPSLGTISHGTMRLEDLIPAFTSELEYHVSRIYLMATDATQEETEEVKAFVDECQNLLAEIEHRQASESYYESDDAMYDLEELESRLNDLCSEYVYFGSNEGDGSDYGFWIHWDSLEDDRRDGELPEDPDDGYVGLWIQVNDHGNATLYRRLEDGTDREVWSCV